MLKRSVVYRYSDLNILQIITKIIKTFMGNLIKNIPTYSSKNIKKLKRKNGGHYLEERSGRR
jgi:hypothetical protein